MHSVTLKTIKKKHNYTFENFRLYLQQFVTPNISSGTIRIMVVYF